jgi:hypothetical protein
MAHGGRTRAPNRMSHDDMIPVGSRMSHDGRSRAQNRISHDDSILFENRMSHVVSGVSHDSRVPYESMESRHGTRVWCHTMARYPVRAGGGTMAGHELGIGYHTMARYPLGAGRCTMAGYELRTRYHAMTGRKLRTGSHTMTGHVVPIGCRTMAEYRWCEEGHRRAYSAAGFAPQASTRPELPRVRGDQETGLLRSRFPRRVHARNYDGAMGTKRRAYSAAGFAPQASTRPEIPMVRGDQETGLLRSGFRAPGEYTHGTTEGKRGARNGLTPHRVSRPRRVHAWNYRG